MIYQRSVGIIDTLGLRSGLGGVLAGSEAAAMGFAIMGYHVSIIRTASGRAQPISKDELVKALASMDGRLVIDPAQPSAVQVVAPAMGDSSPRLLLEDGELWSSSPDDEFINLMIELANKLGARVRGDELETYRTLDDVYNHPDDEPLLAAAARPQQSALWREWKGRLVVMGIGLLMALGYIMLSGTRGGF